MLKHFLLIFILSIGFTYSYADERFSGPPEVTSKYLKSEDLVEMIAHRLAQAEIGWVNLDLLTELGFDVSTKNIEKLKKQILDQYAFAVADDLPKEYFTNERKVFYADRYGGSGTAAFGSGRAAAAGMFQIKGIGRTPLVEDKADYGKKSGFIWSMKHPIKAAKRKLSDRHHSHGAATLREAFTEAVWGEILHEEMPYGSNRIVAIITTELKVGAEPRALIIRENSLRPAHFMRNVMSVKENAEVELHRVKRLNRKIVSLLPSPENPDLRRHPFKSQILEFANRVGRTFGTQFAHSVFHGSTSPSNIEIDGRTLDHGPMTSVDGFSRLMFANDGPNGSITDYRKYIVFEFAEELRNTAPQNLQKYIPSNEELNAQLKFSFHDQVNREFLWRTGAPPELLDQLMETESAVKYTELFKTVALAGNKEKINSRYRVPKNTGTYDIPGILLTLSQYNQYSEYELKLMLHNNIPDDLLRTRFVRAYKNLITDLIYFGLKNEITTESMTQYLKEATALRNKKLEGLYRGPGLWLEQYIQVLKFKLTKDSNVISEYIDKTIKTNSRNDLKLVLKKEKCTESLKYLTKI